MGRLATISRSALIALISLLAGPALAAPECAPGEVLVRWRAGAARPAAHRELDRLNARYGLKAETPLLPPAGRRAKAAGPAQIQRWSRLQLASQEDPRAMAGDYARLELVEAAQPNYLRRCAAVPGDALYPQQWNLGAIGWSRAGLPDAAGVVVAIIDSGVDWTHPDLEGRVWVNPLEEAGLAGVDDDGNGYVDDIRGWDFSDAPGLPGEGDYLEQDPEPMDESGHGTHVAGIIAAKAGNGLGIAGVAPGARLMALRAGFNIEGGGFLEDDDVAAAMVYAAENGAHVLNMSFGDPNFSPLLGDAVRYASQAGCVLVAAAGNESGGAVFYPARLEEAMAVAASGPGDRLLAFSNSGYSIDLAAPGQAILSLLPGNGYGERSGTSMAAAHVSGLAALVLAEHPEFSPLEVRGSLALSARDAGSPGWDPLSGAGIPQVAAFRLERPPELRLRLLEEADSARVRLEMAVPEEQGDYDLSWGQGEAPSIWHLMAQGRATAPQVVEVGWPPASLGEGDYLVRGRLSTPRGGLEERVFVRVQGRAPLARNLRIYPALDGGRWAQMAEWEGPGPAALYLSRPGEAQVLYEIPEWSGRAAHRLRLPEELPIGEYQAEAGAPGGRPAAPGATARFSVESSQVSSWNLVLLATLPDGYLLPRLSDFDGNGRPEVGLMGYRGNRYNPVEFYEGDLARPVHTTSLLFIPWEIGDLDGDGREEVVGVDAQRVRLIEAEKPGAFPGREIWQQEGMWGGEVADLDGDGRDEIFLRSARAELFQVFEKRGDNSLAEIASLPNPTAGSNELGERQVAGDLDGDGLGELLSGDNDGDLFIYEGIGDNAFRLGWREEDRLPPADARLVGGMADLDADGQGEFIAGRLYQDPFDLQQARWEIAVYQARGDNAYAPEWQVEVLGGRAGGNGIGMGDLNGDGLVEFALALPPNLYLFAAVDPDTYGPVWQEKAGEVHRPALGDLDGDGGAELLFNSSGQVGIFGFQAGLPAPRGVVAYPLDQGRIALEWEEVAGAIGYRVYRDGELRAAQVEGTRFEDGQVSAGQEYGYAVAALGPGGEEQRAALVFAQPQDPPRVLEVERRALHQLGVVFSAPIKGVQPYQFRVEPGPGVPSSALLDRGGGRVLLGFAAALPDSGRFALEARGLRSSLGTPLADQRVEFSLEPYREPARAVGAEAISATQVKVRFSQPVRLPEEQGAGFSGQGIQVRRARIQGTEVVLELEIPLQALGQRYEVLFRGLRDEAGNSVEGRVFVRFAAADLAGLQVFPNPFRPAREPLRFVHLPPQVRVYLFDVAGRLVRVLAEEDRDGGMEWDGANAAGEPLQSGVYFYQAVSGTETRRGKFALIRE